MPTPKQQERENRMIRAALKEFCTNGYHNANVDTIAATANVGKGTLYRHYTNKEGLFVTVFEYLLRNLETSLRARMDTTHFEAGIKATMQTLLRELTSNNDLVRFMKLFVSEEFLSDHNLRLKLADVYLQSGLWIAEEMKGAQKRGKLRKSIDPERLTFSLLGMVHFLFYHWQLRGRSYDLAGESGIMFEGLFHGMFRSKKARKRENLNFSAVLSPGD